MPAKGNLIIVSGPSGAGKSALVESIISMIPGLQFSVSYTTRAPRGDERDGLEYVFVKKGEFDRLIQSGDLLEWAIVYGNYYGTSRSFIDRTLSDGVDVLLDVDVQGAQTIRLQRPDALSVFILPPSYDVLRERLRKRSLDKEYIITQRLKIASEEIRQYKSYDFLIINQDLQYSIESLRAIIVGSRCRLETSMEAASSIVANFGGKNAENS